MTASIHTAVPAPPLQAVLDPLKTIPQWLAVRLVPEASGKTRKLPLSPSGVVSDPHAPENWQEWREADEQVRALGARHCLGFVLTREVGVWCLDIDNCLMPDLQWSPQALELVRALPGAAVEVSQSGRGLHIWGRGPVPEHSCKGPPGSGLELYTEGRFMAIGSGLRPGEATGMLGATPGITAVAAHYFPPSPAVRVAANDDGPCVEWRGPTDDGELIRRALAAPASIKRALSGAAHFRDLWNAEPGALGRAFPSDAPGEPYDASRADMALAGELAYWTGRDAARIERLMRRSALAREKWDRHPTYLVERTIGIACAGDRAVLQDPVPANSAGMFVPVPIGELLSKTPEPQRWAWDGLIPAGEVTLLTAHGGVGKSRLVLALAVNVPLGRAFLGRPVEKSPVVVLSAEDGAGTVRRRLASICVAAAVDPRALEAAGLHVWDATGHDPALFAGTPAVPTPAAIEFAQRLERLAPGLVIVDNASDTYAGNEIDRRDVRAFVQWLARTVRPWGGAVLLVAHVSKTTSRAGSKPEDDEGYSGSTAWHNSSRSRLFLLRDADRPDTLRLKHQKCNLGPLSPDIVIHWPSGQQPQAVRNPAAVDPTVTMHALVALLGRAHEQGERLSPAATSPRCAAKVLEPMPDWPAGLSWRDGQMLLERAEREGYLQRAAVPAAKGKSTVIWRPTAK